MEGSEITPKRNNSELNIFIILTIMIILLGAFYIFINKKMMGISFILVGIAILTFQLSTEKKKTKSLLGQLISIIIMVTAFLFMIIGNQLFHE